MRWSAVSTNRKKGLRLMRCGDKVLEVLCTMEDMRQCFISRGWWAVWESGPELRVIRHSGEASTGFRGKERHCPLKASLIAKWGTEARLSGEVHQSCFCILLTIFFFF